MLQKKLTASLFSVLFGAAMMVGCDDTISEKKSTDVKSDGTVVETKEEVKKTDDGKVVEEKSEEEDKPGKANDESSSKTEVKTE